MLFLLEILVSERLLKPISFDNAIFEATGKKHSSINLGMGFSTMKQHYLGLRNMLESKEDILENTFVFIPVESSMPDYSTEMDCWYFTSAPQHLVIHIKFSDLKPFLSSQCDVKAKAKLLRLYALRWSRAMV